jgi:hypothetical protein
LDPEYFLLKHQAPVHILVERSLYLERTSIELISQPVRYPLAPLVPFLSPYALIAIAQTEM